MDRRDTPQGGRRIAFNPYETGSIVPILQEQAQRTARNNQRYKEGLNQNIEALRQTAENQKFANRQYNQEFEQLSKFSETLNEYFTEEANKRNQREMEEGIAAAYTDGISPEQETALERDEEQLAADDVVSQDAAAEAQAQTGSYETARRVANLSGWRGYGYQIGRAQIAAETYGGWIQDQLSGMSFSTNAEAMAAVAELRMQFMRQNGLVGADVAILNKYLFPGMRKGEFSAVRSVLRGIEQDQSYMDQQDAIAAFNGNKDLNQLINRLKNTVDSNGNPLGHRGAHRRAKEILKDLISSGNLTPEEAESLKGQVVSWDSKNRTFGELYPGLIDQAIRDAVRVERDDYRESLEARTLRADAEVARMAEIIRANPEEYTEYDIEQLMIEYRAATDGKESRVLADLLKTSNVTVVERERQREELLRLAQQGRLRIENLRNIDPELYREFRGMVNGSTDAQGNRRGQEYKDALKAIKTSIAKGRGNENPESGIGTETNMIVQEIYDKFNELLLKYEAAGDPNAVRNAQNDAMAYFVQEGGVMNVDGDRNENGRYYRNDAQGRNNYQRMLQNDTANSAARVAELNEIERTLRRDGTEALKTQPGLLLNKQELEAVVRDFGTENFQIPALVNYISKQLNLDPYQVINAQLEASGMEPLFSPAGEAVQEMSPAGQRLLNRFRSQNRSQRGMALHQSQTNAGFDPRTVKYGEIYQRVGAQLGMDPGLIAAMAEIESGHLNDNISYNGSSFGVMQINKASHPEFFENGDWQDAEYNIQYGAQYFQSLIQKYGGDLEAAAMAYNGGPGNYDAWAAGERIPAAVEREMVNHGRKFMRAYSRYQRTALNSPLSMRGDFEIRQIVSTDRRYENDNDPRTLYDPAGHGGDAMHQHYEFATVRQAELAKALYERLGYRVTSHWRPNDHGSAHSHGVAIDVAPPLDLPRTAQAEQAWIDEANAVIGIN